MIYKTQPTETARPHSLSWAQLRAMQAESELRQRIEQNHRGARSMSIIIAALFIIVLIIFGG